MTRQVNHQDVVGLKIVGHHGREIGVVVEAQRDLESWKVTSIEVELNPAALADLKLKKPWSGTQTVSVPTAQVAGACDFLVLKVPVEDMEFSGGKAKKSA